MGSDIVACSLGLGSVAHGRGQGSYVCHRAKETYEISEVIPGAIRTEIVDHCPCDRVAAKESGKDGQTETEVKVSQKYVDAYGIGGG